jgi:chaperonin cofactor prefoldin
LKCYKHQGRIDINSDIYKKIEDLVIQKHFNQYHYLHTKLKADHELLQSEYEKIKHENESLEKRLVEYENSDE